MGKKMKHLSPTEIEAESMRIIEQEAGRHSFSENEWKVVRRIVHAIADFDIMKTIRFHQDAVANGIEALSSGCTIYTDTQMLAAAINKTVKGIRGCSVICFVSDDEVKQKSSLTGETRSVIAVRKAAPFMKKGIIAIGNAPTALHEAISLCERGEISPHLIIGMPVGFVEALESKERLLKSGITCITNIDRKGGTPATAAALNALINLSKG